MNLTIFEEHFVQAIMHYYEYDALENVLMDSRIDDKNVLTIIKYDEESVLIQLLNLDRGITYIILQNDEFLTSDKHRIKRFFYCLKGGGLKN